MGEAGWRLINKPFPKGKKKCFYLPIFLWYFFNSMICHLYTGEQTTMLYDVNRYPQAYQHRHKLTTKNCPFGFNTEGPAEMLFIWSH